MPNRNQNQDERKRDPAHPSSHGINSPSVTPKDVSAGDATAKDVTERPINSDDPDEKEQAMLDDASELSFPASDPPAVSGGTTRIDVPKEDEKK